MSTIQERLARDIAAVTGGVVVTDSDLREAREAVDMLIVGQRQRDRRRTLAATAAAAVVLPILGFAAFQTWGGEDADSAPPPANPAPSPSVDINGDFLKGDAPTPELLQGLWRVDNGNLLLRFSSPDKVAFDSVGQIFRDPGMVGTYTIQGDRITVHVDRAPAACAGQSFAMRASVAKPGNVHVVHTDPGTGDCSEPLNTWWTLEQVLPASKSITDLSTAGLQGWEPLTDRELGGDWLAEGGGHVLELDAGGTYYVADQSGDPVDRGQWSLRKADLTLTSSAASGACNEGDRLVWTDLEQADLGTRVVRGTVRENDCGAAWTPKTWVLLPDETG